MFGLAPPFIVFGAMVSQDVPCDVEECGLLVRLRLAIAIGVPHFHEREIRMPDYLVRCVFAHTEQLVRIVAPEGTFQSIECAAHVRFPTHRTTGARRMRTDRSEIMSRSSPSFDLERTRTPTV